ncbi:DUF2281 domain-containing protein [Magnetovirga frankeli]|uniref:DUF2281 domain-containing protein n=1 Tax=Magnetovirga frankeli TaxID=947516 RepID=UPI001292F790|nr:DUF2281 domain-containing protein [gamma proteobacterium SS-5]
MNIAVLVEKLQGLPAEKQVEVFDFVDYLASRFTPSAALTQTDWPEGDFSTLSLSQAMRGMEEEAELYSLADIKEPWS